MSAIARGDTGTAVAQQGIVGKAWGRRSGDQDALGSAIVDAVADENRRTPAPDINANGCPLDFHVREFDWRIDQYDAFHRCVLLRTGGFPNHPEADQPRA